MKEKRLFSVNIYSGENIFGVVKDTKDIWHVLEIESAFSIVTVKRQQNIKLVIALFENNICCRKYSWSAIRLDAHGRFLLRNSLRAREVMVCLHVGKLAANSPRTAT